MGRKLFKSLLNLELLESLKLSKSLLRVFQKVWFDILKIIYNDTRRILSYL
jgi:hypothetical protein